MKNLKNSLLLMALVLMSVGILSCKVGLGPAVDVEAPVVSVSFPDAGSVIRGTFTISGTWSDDGEIKKVEVSLKSTNNSSDPIDYEGKFSDGVWNCEINPNGSKTVVDGIYVATITVSDNGGHSTVVTRQFTVNIINLSPLFKNFKIK